MLYSACVTHCVCLSIQYTCIVCVRIYVHTHSNHGNLNETHYIANKTFYLFYTHAQPIVNHRITPFIPLPTHILLIVHQSLEDRFFFSRLCVCWLVFVYVRVCRSTISFTCQNWYTDAHFSWLRHLLLCSAPKSKTD